jgi:hypothetical protein
MKIWNLLLNSKRTYSLRVSWLFMALTCFAVVSTATDANAARYSRYSSIKLKKKALTKRKIYKPTFYRPIIKDISKIKSSYWNFGPFQLMSSQTGTQISLPLCEVDNAPLFYVWESYDNRHSLMCFTDAMREQWESIIPLIPDPDFLHSLGIHTCEELYLSGFEDTERQYAQQGLRPQVFGWGGGVQFNGKYPMGTQYYASCVRPEGTNNAPAGEYATGGTDTKFLTYAQEGDVIFKIEGKVDGSSGQAQMNAHLSSPFPYDIPTGAVRLRLLTNTGNGWNQISYHEPAIPANASINPIHFFGWTNVEAGTRIRMELVFQTDNLDELYPNISSNNEFYPKKNGKRALALFVHGAKLFGTGCYPDFTNPNGCELDPTPLTDLDLSDDGFVIDLVSAGACETRDNALYCDPRAEEFEIPSSANTGLPYRTVFTTEFSGNCGQIHEPFAATLTTDDTNETLDVNYLLNHWQNQRTVIRKENREPLKRFTLTHEPGIVNYSFPLSCHIKLRTNFNQLALDNCEDVTAAITPMTQNVELYEDLVDALTSLQTMGPAFTLFQGLAEIMFNELSDAQLESLRSNAESYEYVLEDTQLLVAAAADEAGWSLEEKIQAQEALYSLRLFLLELSQPGTWDGTLLEQFEENDRVMIENVLTTLETLSVEDKLQQHIANLENARSVLALAVQVLEDNDLSCDAVSLED